MGAGSARPLVSSQMRWQARCACNRATAAGISPLAAQHRQPEPSSTSSSSPASSSAWSMPTSPNSLTITPSPPSASWASSAFSKVVLPEPRKPVMAMTRLIPRSSMQDTCLGAFRYAPLPLGGKSRGRASLRDGPLPGFARRRAEHGERYEWRRCRRRFRWRGSGPPPDLPRKRGRSFPAAIGPGSNR